MSEELQALGPWDPLHLGPYTLIGRIGAGGMGQVYLGRSPAGRRVAVKTIRLDSTADDDFRRRFAREAAAARSISGFYTAPVIDADSTGPVPWIATAYVPAPNLDELVDRCGPFTARPLLGLAAHLAEALAAIHGAGLVHRDIKPGNILATADGPLVLDFGIARWPDTETYRLAIGTPAYSSPEQFTGTPESISTASDLYSLTSTLVFAATGQPPYAGSNSMAVVQAVCSGPPALTALPAALRALVAPCVAANPADRPTAAELLGGLAELVSGTDTPPLSASQAAYVARYEGQRRVAPPPGTTRVLTDSWATVTAATSSQLADMTPLLEGGDILVPTTRHGLIRLDAATGRHVDKPAEHTSLHTLYHSDSGLPFTLADSVVVQCAEKGVLSATDTATGDVVWSTHSRAFSNYFTYCSHDPDAGDMVFVDWGTVTLLDLRTGTVRWEVELPGDRVAVWSRPLLTPSAVVVNDEYSRLHALARSDGRFMWSHEQPLTDDRPWRGIIDDPYAGTPPMLVPGADAGDEIWAPMFGRLRRFALVDGRELPVRAGEFRSDGYNGPRVSAVDARLYITAEALYVLDAATTDLLARVPVPSPVGAPLIHDGRVYVNTSTGALYAISVETLDVVPPA
ncbi:protein kinase domain-containing protein [Streptomyces aureus]|uniref:protein kinase domain-containing protein n=1 Tax=Streptomyces aureus TaxID=193461 RepID=UPI0033E990E3